MSVDDGRFEGKETELRLSPLAASLIDSRRIDLSEVAPKAIVDAVVEIAAAHAAAYLERDGDELDRTLVRVLVRDVEGTDEALLAWLAEHPSPERLGIVTRALWQLWSTANPHPPILVASVESLMRSARATTIGATERGPYAAALRMAAKQVGHPGLLAMIDQAQASLAQAPDRADPA